MPRKHERATLVIHDGNNEPVTGEPWIILHLDIGGHGSGVRGEVRCDLTLEEIQPDVITSWTSIRDELKKKLGWGDVKLGKALGLISSFQSWLLIDVAEKAKAAGVEAHLS